MRRQTATNLVCNKPGERSATLRAISWYMYMVNTEMLGARELLRRRKRPDLWDSPRWAHIPTEHGTDWLRKPEREAPWHCSHGIRHRLRRRSTC
jgi:hypothetical protein